MQDYSSPSICSNPENAPIIYHWYKSADGEPNPIAAFRKLISGLEVDEYLKIDMMGNFASLLGNLKRGKLKPINEVKSVRQKRLSPFFELRACYQLTPGDEFLLRVYHAEPSSLGNTVVGLHMHRKLTTIQNPNLAQDVEIDIAIRKYLVGKLKNWDLPKFN